MSKTKLQFTAYVLLIKVFFANLNTKTKYVIYQGPKTSPYFNRHDNCIDPSLLHWRSSRSLIRSKYTNPSVVVGFTLTTHTYGVTTIYSTSISNILFEFVDQNPNFFKLVNWIVF